MDWRIFPITRIRPLEGRTVGSLSANELKGLVPWMEKVKERWERVDDGFRILFAAIQQAMEEQQILQETQANWRDLVISRIDRLNGRRVEELSVAELEWIDKTWMPQIQLRWLEADAELKRHYFALECAVQALRPNLERPIPAVAPQPQESEPITSLKPKQSFEPQMPFAAPQQSETTSLQPPKITTRRRSVSDDVRQQKEGSSALEDPRRQEAGGDALSPDPRRGETQPPRLAENQDGASDAAEQVEGELLQKEDTSQEAAPVGSEPDRRLAIFQYICDEIRKATTLPEALSVKAKAEKLKLQALLDQDKEAQRRYAFARLAAMQKLGEIIADLEKQPLVHDETGRFDTPKTDSQTDFSSVGSRSEADVSSVGSRSEVKKSKTEILKENRISPSTANRYERLAGPSEPKMREAVHKASEQYFSERLEEEQMPKAGELLKVVETVSGIQEQPRKKSFARLLVS